MGKIVLFWLLGIITLVVVFGGGAWLLFWVIRQVKKNNLI